MDVSWTCSCFINTGKYLFTITATVTNKGAARYLFFPYGLRFRIFFQNSNYCNKKSLLKWLTEDDQETIENRHLPHINKIFLLQR